MMFQIILSSVQDTQRLATTLAHIITMPCVIGLCGDLGAGKTTFTQYLGQALGTPGPYPSPTFTLLNEHKSSDYTFVHSDFYRLNSLNEAAHLGLDDYFSAPKTVTIIEWADRFASLLPPEALWMTFELHDERRVVTLRTADENLKHALAKDYGL